MEIMRVEAINIHPNLQNEFAQDLAEIQELQRVFDQELNFDSSQQKLNYNPVLNRWNFEKLRRQSASENQLKQFRTDEDFNIVTALRERNHAAESHAHYSISANGEIYNELFPKEPFEKVLQRGLAYQKVHGSRELIREEKEVEGWLKTMDFLKDGNTPIGAKVIHISPPGLVSGTTYSHNFIDIYESEQNSMGTRRIKMTRNAVDIGYDRYEQIAERFNPNYFEAFEGPKDAWYVQHGIRINSADTRTADEILVQEFGKKEDALSKELQDELERLLVPARIYFIEQVLCKDTFSPAEIALFWNGILNKNDQIKNQLLEGKIKKDAGDYNSGVVVFSHYDTQQELSLLGKQKVQSVAAGCGSSSGFSVENKILISPSEKILANSVAQFGIESDEDEHGSLEFDCPHKECGKKNRREPHKLIANCRHCGKDVRC